MRFATIRFMFSLSGAERVLVNHCRTDSTSMNPARRNLPTLLGRDLRSRSCHPTPTISKFQKLAKVRARRAPTSLTSQQVPFDCVVFESSCRTSVAATPHISCSTLFIGVGAWAWSTLNTRSQSSASLMVCFSSQSRFLLNLSCTSSSFTLLPEFNSAPV